jgi:hypothetical protein
VPEWYRENLWTEVLQPAFERAIAARAPPERFPYKNAIKNLLTVLYFEDLRPSLTRLRLVGLGYGNDEESRKLRNVFDNGNTFTVKKLQKKFAATAQMPKKIE